MSRLDLFLLMLQRRGLALSGKVPLNALLANQCDGNKVLADGVTLNEEHLTVLV